MDNHGWLHLPQLNRDPIPIESLQINHYAIDHLYQGIVHLYWQSGITPSACLGQIGTLHLVNQQNQTFYLHGFIQQISLPTTRHPSLTRLVFVSPLSWFNYFNHAVWGTQSYQHWLTGCVEKCPALELILHIPASDEFQFLAMHNENFLVFLLTCLAQQNYHHTLLQTATCTQWLVTSHPFPSLASTTIHAQLVNSRYQHNETQLKVTTDAIDVFPGQCVDLHPHHTLSSTMIQHSWQIRQLFMTYQHDHEQPLQIQLLLTRQSPPSATTHQQHPSPVLEAFVADAHATHARLDAQGRYALFFPYAQQMIAQPRFSLAQPYQGDQRGFHSPLTPNSRVLVGFLEDDRQQPFILGTLTDDHHPSPVTAANAHMNQWRSISGHRFLIDNRQNQASIQWITANNQVQLRLQDTYHPPGIYGLAKQANIVFQVAQDCQWTAQRTLKWHAQHNVHLTIHQHLQFHCEKELQLTAKHHWQMRAKESFYITTDSLTASTHHSYWQSEQALSFKGTKQVHLSAKNMTWQTNHAIRCRGGKEIIIRHGAAQIHIHQTGEITFTASTIHIHGSFA